MPSIVSGAIGGRSSLYFYGSVDVFVATFFVVMIFYVCAACSIPVMCASCFVIMRFYLIYVVFTNTGDGPLNQNYPTGDAPDGAV